MFTDLPGPPRDLKVSDVTRGTCRLTWKPPACDGGERVKSYFIEKKTVEGKAWTKVRAHTFHFNSVVTCKRGKIQLRDTEMLYLICKVCL